MRIKHVLTIAVAAFAGTGSGCSLYFDHNEDRAPVALDAGSPIADAPVAVANETCGGAAADPAIFKSLCSAPQGPTVILDSSMVAGQLTGCWWMCGGAAEFFGNVEFTADQQFYMLSSVNGRFVRNLSATTSGTYTIDASSASVSFAVHQLYQDGTGATYPLNGEIQVSPRTLALGGGNYAAIQ